MESLLKKFLADCRSLGYREQTIRGHRVRVVHVYRYLEEMGLSVEQMGVREASGYQGWLLSRRTKEGREPSRRSVHAYLVSACGFYRYLKRKGVVLENPFVEIKRVGSEKKLPRKIPREHEMGRLLDALGRFSDPHLKRMMHSYRLHVLGELMYATGLRISEVAQLGPEDVDVKHGVVEVRDGKGGLGRKALLNEYARGVLKWYLEELRPRRRRSRHRRDRLFGGGGERLGKIVNEGLGPVCEELEMVKVTSHGFRHAVGYHLLRGGCPLRTIQELLGHRRLRNTEVYTKVEKEELREMVDRYHPRRWKGAGDEEVDGSDEGVVAGRGVSGEYDPGSSGSVPGV